MKWPLLLQQNEEGKMVAELLPDLFKGLSSVIKSHKQKKTMRKEKYSQDVLDFIENEFSSHLGYSHCNRVFKITDWRNGEVEVYPIMGLPEGETKEFYKHYIPNFNKDVQTKI